MSNRRRYKRKRQTTNPAGFVVCLVFIVAVAVLLNTNVFVVKRISVEGNKSVSDSDIISISGIEYGQKMLSLDTQIIESNFGREGDIKIVSVRKEWPDGVVIEVSQRSLAAVVEYLGTAIMIDEDAYVIKLVSELPTENVPVITGVSVVNFPEGGVLTAENPRQVKNISSILHSLSDWGVLDVISEISLDDMENIHMVTRAGMIVTLGDMTKTDDKIMWMKNVLDELAAQGVNTGKLDVTSGKMAVYSE